MGLGLGLGLGLASRFRVGGFSPALLFAGGEQGAWYDPSDIATLFQDTAGTTPVTAAGQSVARINDKSGRGNHATQAITAARPILGREPVGGRRNLLTYTEQFDNAAWAKGAVTVTGNAGVAPDGTTTADKLFEPTKIAANDALYQTFTTAAVSYAYSVYAKADGANFLYLFWADSTNDHGRYFDLDAGTLGNTVGTAVTNSSIASVGDGWYRCTIVFTGTVGSTFPAMLPSTTNATGRASMVGTTPNGILIWGAQLETGSTATDYQRVVTQYDVTEAGVEDCYYLAFDGTDDSLATAAIDFSATDEMSLFAGMTQTTDGTSCVVETSVDSSANNGAFSLFGIAGTDDVQWLSRGTVSTNVRANVGSKPIIAVYSGLSDVSSDALLLRYNGSQVGSSTGDQGTGNYGSYPLYIGSRAGSSNRLNGRIYSLIVRGALTSGDLLTEAEAYVAGKTGVTI